MNTKSLGLGGFALPLLFGALRKGFFKSILVKVLIYAVLFCSRFFFRRF